MDMQPVRFPLEILIFCLKMISGLEVLSMTLKQAFYHSFGVCGDRSAVVRTRVRTAGRVSSGPNS
jgi:hypothetical protein